MNGGILEQGSHITHQLPYQNNWFNSTGTDVFGWKVFAVICHSSKERTLAAVSRRIIFAYL
jgi:hypothetical protein